MDVGLHPTAPAARYDCQGLAFRLEHGRNVVALTRDTATISTATDARLTFYRPRHAAGAVLAWQLVGGGNVRL